ncbi:hypothetical protein [Aestuariicoccus sp. MJ-SS9]|uniref:hypothetical protein n=1 Tax=Aestuariicoccus sp. MJ-SS9 TaxID=3079855 RepID=UPI002907A626|nr:hypothetical protein [Aestuariicoccus sp. MJ-SS9]MDU8912891.1 hypothetical protein [Aestuariicoccus sp. MJ-SS9]
MDIRRRVFLGLMLAGLAEPARAFDARHSLADRQRFRSFGGGDWVFDDPFERSRPGARALPLSAWRRNRRDRPTDQLLDLIGFAEAGRLQYDAVHMSARRKPPARPTELTIGQIKRWIRATPGQHHAIGRYQFIPSTLTFLVRRAGLAHGHPFQPAVQDHLARMLLRDAGYEKFLAGQMSLARFMDSLALIWAGLPLQSGKSAYRGVAGNRATISRRFYAEQMQAIFA